MVSPSKSHFEIRCADLPGPTHKRQDEKNNSDDDHLSGNFHRVPPDFALALVAGVLLPPDHLLAIRIERFVNRQLVFQLLVIVAVSQPKAFSNRIKARDSGAELLRIGIGASDDQRKSLQRGITRDCTF